jgi:purine-binding chemotaxis protein CheW
MIIIVDVTNMQKSVLMGLFVDEVTDVIEFDYKSIRAVPDLGIKYNPEFLEGFVENNDKFVMVLDTDRVFSVAELAETSMIPSV